MLKKKYLADYDMELWKIMHKEMIRQEQNISLIASENYASTCVMQAQGSCLTNKYAEGYPENRYYGGCIYTDKIEKLAITRAKVLFGVDYVNVQPHSGSQANFAVYNALLNPGEVLLGMKMDHGGHLTHGFSANFSGKFYKSVFYGVDNTGNINYSQLAKLAKIYKPKIIVGGFSSYSGSINWDYMRYVADNVGAYLLADISHVAGLVVAGVYPNPISFAHVVTTTTHKTLSGPRGGIILSNCGDKEMYKKLDVSVFPGSQGGPLMHIIAAKAVAFKEAMEPSFKIYQQKIVKNAQIMVHVFYERGFDIVSGFTYNHLFLLNLLNMNISGKDAEKILNQANIIVNKNSIPNDQYSSNITSGIRIGTPAITKRGLREKDVEKLAHWISDILQNFRDTHVIKNVKRKIIELCSKYPIYMINILWKLSSM
ncbi:MAG: serine hydroxymethyltransferase [Candidatus Westeberhardia cardiocondylae]|nr:serine hydroxymethyltransferase [Candidatus Westeberhardia cardiocondylae]